MKNKEIMTAYNAERKVKVTYSKEYDEYTVFLFINNVEYEAATYYTDNEADALQTAQELIGLNNA